jgi:hypothetical protein
MTITNTGKDYISKIIAGSGTIPNYCAVGSGSGTATASSSGLLSEFDRNTITSIDYTTTRKITYSTDFSSVEMSGLNLREISINHLSSGGQAFSVDRFQAVEFDGSNEAQIEVTWEFF